MAPFNYDNILYIRHHKLLDEQYNINSIAEAVVNWGICDDFDGIDEYYQTEELAHIHIITTTVSNLLHFFEVDFEQIISKHCNGNMSKEQFVTFVCNRCNVLSKISGYFGYLMPCAFMRETMFRFKFDFRCSNFFILAQECLAKFLEKKFQEFENIISFWGFMSYCKDINSQFCEKIHHQAQDSEQLSDEEQYLVNINIIENSDPTVNSTDGKYEASNIIMPLVASDFDRTNASNVSGYRNDGNNIFNKFPDNTFMPITKSDGALDLSEQININENLDLTVNSTYGRDGASNSIMPQVASDFDRTNSSNASGYRNDGNDIFNKFLDNMFMPYSEWDGALDLSEEININENLDLTVNSTYGKDGASNSIMPQVASDFDRTNSSNVSGYRNDGNDTFNKFLDNMYMPYSKSDGALDLSKKINNFENLDSTVNSTDRKDKASNTITPLDASGFDRTNSSNVSGYKNNGNNIFKNFKDNTFMTNTKSDGALGLSQAICETCFEGKTEYWIRINHFENYVYSSDGSFDISSNNTDTSKDRDDTLISKTNSDKIEDLTESMSKLNPGLEQESSMNEENVSTDGDGSCDISSITRSSTETSKEEFIVLFNILMPDDEFAAEVFNCISECLDLID